jgi:hypothetical protein
MGGDVPEGTVGLGPCGFGCEADVAEEMVIQSREAAALSPQGKEGAQAKERCQRGPAGGEAEKYAGETGHGGAFHAE